jgi:hypothetical protein
MKPNERMTVSLSNTALLVGETELPETITESAVYAAIGPANRIEEGTPPAPPGHHNNAIYFYDNYGLYWICHHTTRIMIALGVVFHPDLCNPLQRQPRRGFCGELVLLGCRLNCRSTMRELTSCPDFAMRRRFGGTLIGCVAGHDISVGTRILEDRENEIADVEIGFGKPLF